MAAVAVVVLLALVYWVAKPANESVTVVPSAVDGHVGAVEEPQDALPVVAAGAEPAREMTACRVRLIALQSGGRRARLLEQVEVSVQVGESE